MNLYQTEATHLGQQFFSICRIALRHEPERAQRLFGISSPTIASAILDMEPDRIRELCLFGLPYLVPALAEKARVMRAGEFKQIEESSLSGWEQKVVNLMHEHIYSIYHWASHDQAFASLWGRIRSRDDLVAITSLGLANFRQLALLVHDRVVLDPSTSMQLAITFCHSEAAQDRLVVSRALCPIAA